MNEVLATKLLEGNGYPSVFFGEEGLFAYEKFYEVVAHRLLGTDKASRITYSPEDGLEADGCGVDPCGTAYERYCWEGGNFFDEVYEMTPQYLDGEVKLIGFYDQELAELYESNNGSMDEIERLLDTEGIVKDKMSFVDETFYEAIPRMEEMMKGALMDGVCDECESYFAYLLSSPKAGAFIEWADKVKVRRRGDRKKIDELKKLFGYIEDPMDSNYVHTGIYDHVWYSITFVGDIECGYGNPRGTWELGLAYLPALYFFSKGVDELNEVYGFYRKEVKDEAQQEAA